jgi:hypothetical protein
MFAPELGTLVQGRNIDQLYNGVLSMQDLHKGFGALEMWLEATEVNYYQPKIDICALINVSLGT